MLLGCPFTIARSEIRQYLGMPPISAGRGVVDHQGRPLIFLNVFLELRAADVV
jgi:hypothetical protein